MAETITIQEIRKTYGPVVALDRINLDVGAGEFVSILGPSGSGKTTLLMILAGFVQPDHGSIRFTGREVVTMPPYKRDIGLVFQNYALFPHMTVAGNVGFPLRYRKFAKSETRKMVAGALELVRLGGYEDRRIDELSGGQKQRVALARALVFNPRILLMDEPLSALDKKLREQMQIEIRELQRRLGMTTIYVTHDQREALTMSDRIAVMNNGAIQQIGTPSQIYEEPGNLFVASFLGDSQLLRVDMVGDSTARMGDATIRLRKAPGAGAGEGFLVLRPEKFEIVRDVPKSSELNAISGRVKDVVYQGENVLVLVALPTGETVSIRRATNEGSRRHLPAAGEHISLGIHPADTIVVKGAT
ncbi:MAG: ABC transporter ATP-binding protein [Pseudomonadota bacterium]